MSKLEIVYWCSNCGKREVTSPVIGVPEGMYALGYRAVGNAIYCPECVRTWPERNGDEFDAEYRDPGTMFARWWNRQVEAVADASKIRRYRVGAGGILEEVRKNG